MSAGKDTQVTLTSYPQRRKSAVLATSEELGVEADVTSDHETIVTYPRIPKRYRYVALACVVAFPIGNNWTGASLGPLKNTLRNEFGINNAQFGVISSADGFVNTLFPIFGGLIMDWWGPNVVTICCTSIMFAGSLIAAGSTNADAWRMLVGGHVLMGFGVAVLDTAQQKFFYHWFGAAGLAFAFGLENAVASTTSLVAGMTAIPIKEGTGWYGWSFWIPAVFCGLSMFVNIAYVCFERFVVPKQYWLTSARAKTLASQHGVGRKRIFSFKTLLELPWCYLMLPATQLLQSGAAGGFGVSAADMITMKGYEERVAGYLSTAQRILPIVLSPMLGWVIDVYGHRFHYVALAPILWIIACSLIGFTDVHPLAALVFSSLAGVVNSMPLQICIPLLVADQSKLGTAFGVWRAFNNSGSTIMDVVFGVLQDDTADMGYDKVLKLAIGIKAWAFMLAILYIVVDYRCLGKGMTMTRKAREKREGEIVANGIDPAKDPLTRREPNKWATVTTGCLLIAIACSAWAVFIRYLM